MTAQGIEAGTVETAGLDSREPGGEAMRPTTPIRGITMTQQTDTPTAEVSQPFPPSEIWLFPEQGDPGAGEWFWTADLATHDPDDVGGNVRYTRADLRQSTPAVVEAAIKFAAHEWWRKNMPTSMAREVIIHRDGRVSVCWHDDDESGTYGLPVDFMDAALSATHQPQTDAGEAVREALEAIELFATNHSGWVENDIWLGLNQIHSHAQNGLAAIRQQAAQGDGYEGEGRDWAEHVEAQGDGA